MNIDQYMYIACLWLKTKFNGNKSVQSAIMGRFSYRKNRCKHIVLSDVNKSSDARDMNIN